MMMTTTMLIVMMMIMMMMMMMMMIVTTLIFFMDFCLGSVSCSTRNSLEDTTGHEAAEPRGGNRQSCTYKPRTAGP